MIIDYKRIAMRKINLSEESLGRLLSDAKQRLELIDIKGIIYHIPLTESTIKTTRHFVAIHYQTQKMVVLRYSEITKALIDYSTEIVFSLN